MDTDAANLFTVMIGSEREKNKNRAAELKDVIQKFYIIVSSPRLQSCWGW